MFNFNIGSLLKDDHASNMVIDAKETVSYISDGKTNYKVLEPIQLKGEFESIGNGIVRFTGEIRSKLESRCSRCSTKVEYPLAVEFEQRFSSGFEGIDQEDIESVVGERVDLEPIVMEELHVSIPMSVLCKEDCKGLCSTCGGDLNVDGCDCASTDIDPRLSGLKDFFKS